MKIEKRSPLSYSPEEMVVVKAGDEANTYNSARVSGLRIESDVFVLSDLDPFSWILTLNHEYGHYLGDQISFRDGSVMSPFKIQQSRISLDRKERRLLSPDDKRWQGGRRHRLSQKEIDILIEICERIISSFVLTQQRVGLEQVTLHSMTRQELVEVVRGTELVAAQVMPDGEIINLNRKQDRDIELPALFIELASAQILENTMIYYRMIDEDTEFIVPAVALPHQRAQNIVSRAFEYNYLVPSLLDIRQRE